MQSAFKILLNKVDLLHSWITDTCGGDSPTARGSAGDSDGEDGELESKVSMHSMPAAPGDVGITRGASAKRGPRGSSLFSTRHQVDAPACFVDTSEHPADAASDEDVMAAEEEGDEADEGGAAAQVEGGDTPRTTASGTTAADAASSASGATITPRNGQHARNGSGGRTPTRISLTPHASSPARRLKSASLDSPSVSSEPRGLLDGTQSASDDDDDEVRGTEVGFGQRMPDWCPASPPAPCHAACHVPTMP